MLDLLHRRGTPYLIIMFIVSYPGGIVRNR